MNSSKWRDSHPEKLLQIFASIWDSFRSRHIGFTCYKSTPFIYKLSCKRDNKISNPARMLRSMSYLAISCRQLSVRIAANGRIYIQKNYYRILLQYEIYLGADTLDLHVINPRLSFTKYLVSEILNSPTLLECFESCHNWPLYVDN